MSSGKKLDEKCLTEIKVSVSDAKNLCQLLKDMLIISNPVNKGLITLSISDGYVQNAMVYEWILDIEECRENLSQKVCSLQTGEKF